MKYTKTEINNNYIFVPVFVIYFLLSAVVVPRLNNYGYGIVPDAMFALCMVFSLFANKKSACIYAVIFGTLMDLFVMPPFHFSPVVYFLSAYFITRFSWVFSKITAPVAAVCSVPFLLARAVVGMFYLLYSYKAPLGQIMSKCIAPEFFFNLAAVIVTFFIFKLVLKIFKINK